MASGRGDDHFRIGGPPSQPSAQVGVLLVAGVVVPHPLRVADHRGVVARGSAGDSAKACAHCGDGTTRRVHSPS